MIPLEAAPQKQVCSLIQM